MVLGEDLRDVYYLVVALFRYAFQFYDQNSKINFFFLLVTSPRLLRMHQANRDCYEQRF